MTETTNEKPNPAVMNLQQKLAGTPTPTERPKISDLTRAVDESIKDEADKVYKDQIATLTNEKYALERRIFELEILTHNLRAEVGSWQVTHGNLLMEVSQYRALQRENTFQQSEAAKHPKKDTTSNG